MFRTGPERQEMVQRPRELIPAVCVNRLEQAKHNPDVHGKDMQVFRDGAPEDRRTDGTESEDHDFNGRCVLSGKTERRAVLMVDLVDIFVERAPVHGSVRPVVPGIFHDEEDGYLEGHFCHRGKGDSGGKAEELAHRVEEPGGVISSGLMRPYRLSDLPNLGKLDGEMREKNEEGALPLLVGGWDFVLYPVSPSVHQHGFPQHHAPVEVCIF